MHVGLIDGPGHHGAVMASELCARGHTVTRTRSYPSFQVSTHRPGAPVITETRGIDAVAHDAVRRISSGLVHRLSRWMPASYDFDLYTRAYDRIAFRHMAACQAVIGFSFVAGHALREARRRGQLAVLESPTCHLATHLELLDEEYRRAGQAPSNSGLVFSRFALQRAREEYAQADVINVLSSFARKTLIDRGIAPDKIVVSTLGIDIDQFQPAPAQVGDRPFRVLFVGRIELHKGIRYLLEAFARLRLPGAQLRLVGQVREDAQPYLAAHGAGVEVVAPVPREQLARFYQEADVLVFPTISDGFGLVMLEAMACGLPVIATDHSGGPDVIREGQDGFVVPIRDSDALAARISELAQDAERRREMGTRARDRVTSSFKLAHYGERLEANVVRRIRRAGNNEAERIAS